MRLTLRTLLAFMDEILEPADREELAKKVESSDFANELIHRTKDTMRRLRLSAPQVVGTGMGLDPNTVAEYLDNVLPPESVADFERICLESDVHLAEVASAHHVLTMVLGEPAEVDPIARQRMYGIPAEAERRKHAHAEPVYGSRAAPPSPAAVTPSPHVFTANSAAPVRHVATHTDEVPDYLRANAWTRHGTLLAACAAVLLLAVGWILYTAFPGWFGGGAQVALAPQGANLTNSLQPPAQPPVEPTASDTEVAETEIVEETVTTEIVAATPDAGSATTAQPSEGAAPSMTAAPPRLNMPAMAMATPPVSTPPAAVAEPATTTEAAPPSVAMDESAYGYGDAAAEPDDRYAGGEAQPTPPQATAPQATTEAPAANIVPAPIENSAPQPTDTATATPVIPAEPNLIPPASTVEPATTATVVVPPPIAEQTSEVSEQAALPPAEPVELGTYLDGKNVLLKMDPQSGAWFRLTPRSTLQSGDKLLALPAFYPKLALSSGLHVKLAGGTLITLGPTAADSNEPAIEVVYGKAVLVNTSNEESGLKLTMGGETADVRLARNATLAVDAVPKYQPGLDPRKSSGPIVADLYVRDGDVKWTDAGGGRDIPAPAQWKIEGGVPSPPSANNTFPDWIDQEPVEQRSEKMFGAPAVETALDLTRPVEEQLLELYESSRRREVKSLVARSSVYAGLFVPFVEALRDSDQKSSWKMHVDTLRSAMALGPESAERIYQTLVDQRGKAAADELYEMLCGYDVSGFSSPDEFCSGLGSQLVDRMENDSLDYRVLAVQDMSELTGMRLMSNPAGSPTERARGVRLWRQRLKDGEIELAQP